MGDASFETQPPRKRVKLAYTTMFDVMVGSGENSERFTLPHDLFTGRSEFFKAARSPRWNTDPSKPVDMTDHDPKIFAVYLNCVYKGSEDLPSFLNGEQYGDIESLKPPGDDIYVAAEGLETYFKDRFYYLTELYFLADKIMDHTIANDAVDEIIDMCDRCGVIPNIEDINVIYARTIKGMGLRKLMLDYLINEVSKPEVGKLDTDVLEDYVSTVASAIVAEPYQLVIDVLRVPVACLDSSRYHRHDED